MSQAGFVLLCTVSGLSMLCVSVPTDAGPLGCGSCSLVPSALLDSTARRTSWALQACQLWELLRDARLLCRHVGLQQVCCMVTRATTPPPAVLQHRQQVWYRHWTAAQYGADKDMMNVRGPLLLLRGADEQISNICSHNSGMLCLVASPMTCGGAGSHRHITTVKLRVIKQ